MATPVCAYGTAILTNREPSELVAERIFCASQVRTRTIHVSQKNDCLKNISYCIYTCTLIVYSIISIGNLYLLLYSES